MRIDTGPVTAPPSGRRALLVLLAVVVGLAVVAGGLWWSGRDGLVKAGVGDCLKGATAARFEIVDCGSADASFAVLGLVQDRSDEEAEEVLTVCARWPDADTDYWRPQPGTKGIVTCLKHR